MTAQASCEVRLDLREVSVAISKRKPWGPDGSQNTVLLHAHRILADWFAHNKIKCPIEFKACEALARDVNGETVFKNLTMVWVQDGDILSEEGPTTSQAVEENTKTHLRRLLGVSFSDCSIDITWASGILARQLVKTHGEMHGGQKRQAAIEACMAPFLSELESQLLAKTTPLGPGGAPKPRL